MDKRTIDAALDTDYMGRDLEFYPENPRVFTALQSLDDPNPSQEQIQKIMVDKVPSDGLQAKTDEDNLGFTYAVLDRYIREGVIEDEETKKRIDHLHKINAFKLKYMDCFEYVPEE